MSKSWKDRRAELGPVSWQPALGLRILEWKAWRRRYPEDIASGREWGTRWTWWNRVLWHWAAFWWILLLRQKSLAIRERELRLDREQRFFERTGWARQLPPGTRERAWLGYEGMHFDTLQSPSGPAWAAGFGLTNEVFGEVDR